MRLQPRETAREASLNLREANPADHPALQALITHGPGPTDSALLEQHLRHPRYRPALTLLATRGDRPVGCALLAHERLRLGAATLEIGLVQALLAPDPDTRAALLGASLGALVEQGLPLVLLRGTRAEFGPLGLAPFRHRAETLLPAQPPGAPALRPAGPQDLEALAALYDACYTALPLQAVRAAPDWRAWLEQRAVSVLDDQRGRTVAYAARGGVADSDAVREAAAADAGAARALLAALAAGQPCRLTLPPQHLVALAALQLGGQTNIRAAAQDGPLPLAGVVDLPGALQALAPELTARLARSRYAGWSGRLSVELAGEQAGLRAAGGRVVLDDPPQPPDLRLRSVSLPALAQLCLGYRSAADLRAEGGLACDDTALGLIDALFPVELGSEA